MDDHTCTPQEMAIASFFGANGLGITNNMGVIVDIAAYVLSQREAGRRDGRDEVLDALPKHDDY